MTLNASVSALVCTYEHVFVFCGCAYRCACVCVCACVSVCGRATSQLCWLFYVCKNATLFALSGVCCAQLLSLLLWFPLLLLLQLLSLLLLLLPLFELLFFFLVVSQTWHFGQLGRLLEWRNGASADGLCVPWIWDYPNSKRLPLHVQGMCNLIMI